MYMEMAKYCTFWKIDAKSIPDFTKTHIWMALETMFTSIFFFFWGTYYHTGWLKYYDIFDILCTRGMASCEPMKTDQLCSRSCISHLALTDQATFCEDLWHGSSQSQNYPLYFKGKFCNRFSLFERSAEINTPSLVESKCQEECSELEPI